MTSSKRFTKPRIIVFSLLAALVIAVNVYWCCITYIAPMINRTFIFEFIVAPIVLILLIALVIFSNLKLSNKIGLGVLILILIWFVSVFWIIFGAHEDFSHFENNEISEQYSEVTKDFKKMPSLSELGEIQNTDYYIYRLQSFFMNESYTLICSYDESEYQKQKDLLEQNYVFQSEPLTVGEHTCPTEVTVDGYMFRMVAIEDGSSLIFPKRMMFIATNDDTNEIVYMAFEDLDLDYIDSLADFITNSCGWKHLR